MFDKIILQIGIPADVCIQFFFGIFESCVNIASKDVDLLSKLALASNIAVPAGIGAVIYLFIRTRRSKHEVQKAR